VDADNPAFNRDPHGTEVAGIIGAIGDNHVGIVGIAPKSVISIYKACWYPTTIEAGARCNSFTLAKALAAILDTDARVVNLSLGGPSDPLLDKLLAQLLEQRRIVVAAMPPDGSTRGFPDSAPGVLVVRMSGASPAPPGVLSAPGNDILTTQPGGGYDFTSGSSMAAAHVSGIVALLLSLSPSLDAQTVHDLLLSSSKSVGGMRQVDAAAAVTALRRNVSASRR
jgi:subtilisin family serine protease